MFRTKDHYPLDFLVRRKMVNPLTMILFVPLHKSVFAATLYFKDFNDQPIQLLKPSFEYLVQLAKNSSQSNQLDYDPSFKFMWNVLLIFFDISDSFNQDLIF